MAYDPVKAHEYYEKYRKKGLKKKRKQAKNLDTGAGGGISLSATPAKGVKKKKAKQSSLKAQSKAKISGSAKQAGTSKGGSSSSRASGTSSTAPSTSSAFTAENAAKLEEMRTQIQNQISALKTKLDGMSKEERAKLKDDITFQINQLKKRLSNTVGF